MTSRHGLAVLALVAALSGCSPAAQTDADEKSFRAEPIAAADPSEAQPPVLDAQGNELDPQLADAVRAKMEEDQAAPESGGDDASAPTDDGVAASDDET